MPHARHGFPSGSRHTHRPASPRRGARRPRVVVLAAVAAAGLAVAFWVPGRNDSAAASENGRHSAGSYQGDDHGRVQDWMHDRRHRDRKHPSPSASPSPSPSPSPTSEPPTSEPPTSEPPTSEPPTSEPPTSESPTSEPPTVAPTTTRPTAAPTTAPAATKWAPFTDYTAGQVVTFQTKKFEVLEAHTSLPGWAPPLVPVLFAKIG